METDAMKNTKQNGVKKKANSVSLTTRLERQQAQFDACRKALNVLREEKFETEELPKMKANIGKCFRYRNNYSCPEKPSDYWWLYRKITGVKDGSYTSFQFQTDRDGMVRIEQKEWDNISESDKEITDAEFNHVWKETLAKIKQSPRLVIAVKFMSEAFMN